MNPTRSLVCSTAAFGAGLLTTGLGSAAEVKPGGSLDITVEGFAHFIAGVGDLKEKIGGRNGGFDFRNDTEVHFIAKGKHEPTGIDYGATIEFEADTNRTGNTDETWIFIKGGFGELRLGDDDGIAKDLALGTFNIAVGTSGVDGQILDTPAVKYLTPSNSDSTKIKYYSPTIAGFRAGVGYTPHVNSGGDNIGVTNDGGVDDYLEGGLQYGGALAGVDFLVSVVGGLGHINANVGDDDVRGIYGSAQIGLFGAKLAGGWGTEEVGGIDRKWFNIGAAYRYGAVSASLTYGDCYDCDAAEPSILVAGVEVGLFPGVFLSGEIASFDEDRGGNDDGVLGVVRLGAAF